MIIFFSLPFQSILTWLHTEADCRVSNTRMFQGQNVEVGTFESQPVREWNLVFDSQNIIQFKIGFHPHGGCHLGYLLPCSSCSAIGQLK